MRGCELESFEVDTRYVNPIRPGSADPKSEVPEMKKEKHKEKHSQ
jgi:hypothetical protein